MFTTKLGAGILLIKLFRMENSMIKVLKSDYSPLESHSPRDIVVHASEINSLI